MNYKDVIDFPKPNQTKKMTIRDWCMHAVWNKLWLEPTLLFCCLDHIFKFVVSAFVSSGLIQTFLICKKKWLHGINQIQKDYFHFEEKRQKQKFVFQYQVLTIIQLNYLCFFLLYLHIYVISCKNRIASLTSRKKTFRPALKELDWRNTECLAFFEGECALDRDSE